MKQFVNGATAARKPAMTDQAAQSGYHEIVQAAYAPCVVRIGSEPSPMHDDYATLIGAGRVLVVEKVGIVQG
ncbi:hypothetical protein [Acidocella aminolytica]|nr:hypothetical protein [Acidocella aminolytica]GBQ32726.1 hypothetical protein AA11237_0236 [Acidocella aminolytica 101 = DSM 11237]